MAKGACPRCKEGHLDLRARFSRPATYRYALRVLNTLLYWLPALQFRCTPHATPLGTDCHRSPFKPLAVAFVWRWFLTIHCPSQVHFVAKHRTVFHRMSLVNVLQAWALCMIFACVQGCSFNGVWVVSDPVSGFPISNPVDPTAFQVRDSPTAGHVHLTVTLDATCPLALAIPGAPSIHIHAPTFYRPHCLPCLCSGLP